MIQIEGFVSPYCYPDIVSVSGPTEYQEGQPVTQGVAEHDRLVATLYIEVSPNQADEGGSEELGNGELQEKVVHAVEGREVVSAKQQGRNQNG